MTSKVKRFFQHAIIFLISFVTYSLIELVFKTVTGSGSNHLSMGFVAGIAGVLAINGLNSIWLTYDLDFLLQGAICALFITILEFMAGLTWNTDYAIWDYRELPLSFGNGHVNIIFTFFWFLLSLLFIPIFDYIDWKIFKFRPETPPYYIVFGRKVFQFKIKF